MTERQRTRADSPPRTREDHQLTTAILEAQQGDEQAFRHIYRTVQPRLLNYARALVGESDAEDVTAEAWACIARDLDRFHGDGRGFLAWSAAITRHRATDHLRRRRPVTPLSNEQLPEQSSLRDAAGEAAESLGTAAALALIGGLPKEQAQAILLRVVMGLDTATTARILGKRTGAVRTATYRGLHTLAGRLSPEAVREQRGNPLPLPQQSADRPQAPQAAQRTPYSRRPPPRQPRATSAEC